MSSSLTNLLYHIVFSTKNRTEIITKTYQEELYKYIGGIIKEKKGILLAIGGMSDHIHIFMKSPASISISYMLKEIKGNSSKWVNNNRYINGKFNWQIGYSAFSVSQSQSEKLENYINNQEAHHKDKLFKDELIELLEKHEIEYDERYLWD